MSADDLCCPSCGNYRDTPMHEFGCAGFYWGQPTTKGQPTMSDENEGALTALQHLGWAWRGDWSNFDGRMLRDEIDSWVAMFREGATPEAVSDWRASCGLCQTEGHWTYHCGEDCLAGAPVEDGETQQ